MYPVITISREVGSGGHAIGEKVAEMLGIPFYDREIIEKVAQTTGYDAETVQSQGEYASALQKYLGSKFYNGLYLGDAQDEIFYAQKIFILEKAKEGPCVIVGRCADYILEEAKVPTLNVFIHADLEYRKKNVARQLNDENAPIEKILAGKAKGRKYYYRYYTDREWGDYQNYHLNLDSGYLGEDTCAQLIAEIAKAKQVD